MEVKNNIGLVKESGEATLEGERPPEGRLTGEEVGDDLSWSVPGLFYSSFLFSYSAPDSDDDDVVNNGSGQRVGG